MADMKMKGIAMVHFREFVIKRAGEKGLEEIAAMLSPEAGKILTQPAACDWYELTPIVEIEHAIVKKLLHGDITAIAELGEYDATESINKVYRILFRLLDPASLVRKSGSLWSRFYDRGQLRVEQLGPRRLAVHATGHSPLDVIHCHEFRGGLLGCIRVCGYTTGRVEHSACVLTGSPACTYELTW